jgi:predicted RNase H-like HicB family nuclease
MEYTILIHQAGDGGFWSEIPALPGCYSDGSTLEDVLKNTRKEIEDYILSMKMAKAGVPVKEDFIVSRITVESAVASTI